MQTRMCVDVHRTVRWAAWLRLPLGDFFRSQTDSLALNSWLRIAFCLSSNFLFVFLPRLIRVGPEQDW